MEVTGDLEQKGKRFKKLAKCNGHRSCKYTDVQAGDTVRNQGIIFQSLPSA